MLRNSINQSFAKSLPKGIDRNVGFFNEEDLAFNTQYKEFVKHLTDVEFCQFMAKYGVICKKFEELLAEYNEIAVKRIDNRIDDANYLNVLCRDFHTKNMAQKLLVIEKISEHAAIGAKDGTI